MEENPQNSTEYFAAVAPKWDELRKGLFPEELRDKALRLARVRPGGLAADIGAGSGFLTEALLDAGSRVIAVDRSPEMLAQIRRKFAGRDVEARQGESLALPLADGAADCVLANMYLHHVEEPAAAIREMARVLRPGGRLVITDLIRHDHEWVLTEFHDRWLGFEYDAVTGWLEGAGLHEIRIEDSGALCSSRSREEHSCGEIPIFAAGATK